MSRSDWPGPGASWRNSLMSVASQHRGWPEAKQRDLYCNICNTQFFQIQSNCCLYSCEFSNAEGTNKKSFHYAALIFSAKAALMQQHRTKECTKWKGVCSRTCSSCPSSLSDTVTLQDIPLPVWDTEIEGLWNLIYHELKTVLLADNPLIVSTFQREARQSSPTQPVYPSMLQGEGVQYVWRFCHSWHSG